MAHDAFLFGVGRTRGDVLKPPDLLDTARLLANAEPRRPRQANLCRSVSTIYYALFHMVCRNAADCLIGTSGSDRSNPAWQQVYRSVDHGFARNQCRNAAVMRRFPAEIAHFATVFVEFQEQRHAADYDPAARFRRSQTLLDLSRAESALAAFQRTSLKDRRAFAAWITLRARQG